MFHVKHFKEAKYMKFYNIINVKPRLPYIVREYFGQNKDHLTDLDWQLFDILIGAITDGDYILLSDEQHNHFRHILESSKLKQIEFMLL